MKRERDFFSLFLLAGTFGAMAGLIILGNKNWQELLKPYAMTAVMVLVMGAALRAEKFRPLFTERQFFIGAAGWLFSILAVSLAQEAWLFNWWMLGSGIAALYLHPYLGLAMHGILSYLLCSLYGYGMDGFLFYGLIGVILCGLARYLTTLASFAYILAIALSSNATLFLIQNNFSWSRTWNKNTWYSLASTGAVAVVLYFLRPGRKEEEKKKDGNEKSYNEALDKILAESFPLRKKLFAYSQSLYSHSLRISSLAQDAALCIGCNDKITQAGGLYHEIGRIQGQDYIVEGVKLGKAHGFPDTVVDIICQHNSKYEKPQSVEAAVVMLTDSIVSTIEYMDKGQKDKKAQVSAEKLIEQIFDIRLAKGTLDESGMDIQSYRKLKDFFKKEYSKGENR